MMQLLINNIGLIWLVSNTLLKGRYVVMTQSNRNIMYVHIIHPFIRCLTMFYNRLDALYYDIKNCNVTHSDVEDS